MAGAVLPVASVATTAYDGGWRREAPARSDRRASPAPRAASRFDHLAAGLAGRFSDAGLVIDLGDRIGSARWWRGFATLGTLVAGTLSLGLSAPTLIGAVPPRAADAVIGEQKLAAIAPLAQDSTTGQAAPPTAMVRRLGETPERPRVELTATIGAGGLEGTLRRAGVGRADLAALRSGLSGVVRSGNIPRGTPLEITLGRRESRADPRPLESLAFRAAFDMNVAVSRTGAGELRVRPIPIRIDETPLRVTGLVGRSLSQSARAAGVPTSVVNEYVRQMSHIVDFQREVRAKDRFDFIIEHRRAETGETQMGRLLYAGLENNGREIALLRWGKSGKFYRDNGEGARQGLMRTPVDGARISSGFGKRRHPILGYSRMHQGIDFAASTGTPVLASASGRITRAGWGGGYGNIVMIDHGKGIVTRYAHLSKISARAGQKVNQGEVIGRVGSTGMSTGPHLHYEVWQNGKPVDPRQARFQSSDQLGGRDLASFKQEMRRLTSLRAVGEAGQMAAAGADGKNTEG